MPNSEKRKELTRQIIIRIKEVIKDMPDAEVLQRMLDAGEQTSISTIRRLKAEGSEDTGFNYELTIKPFAKVFLELSQKPVNVEELDSDAEKDRAALENIVLLKNLENESLKKEIALLEEKLAESKAESEKKIYHLKTQIEKQDDLIDKLNKILDDRKAFMDERRDFIYRKDRVIAILGILLAFSVTLIFAALVIDVMNPDMGFFWLDDMAAKLFNGHLSTGVSSMGVNL